MNTKIWCALALAIPCLAAPAVAGVVRGVLRPPAIVPAAPAARSAYSGSLHALPGSHAHPAGRVADAVISIEGLPAAAESTLTPEPVPPQLAQQNQSFVPHVLPVAVGSTVVFPNFDPIFHNVFSVSPGKRFDLGKYPRGHSRRVRFDRPGVIQVYCDIHSNMAAFIVVLPSRAFTQPDDAGAFALSELPAGEYTLRVWHPDYPPLSRRIRVPKRGDLDLDLGYDAASAARPGIAESGERE
jgi:plastocyanin